MALGNFLETLTRAINERSMAKEFGPDFRERERKLALTERTAGSADLLRRAQLKASTRAWDAKLRAAQQLHPDLDPESALAAMEGEDIKLGRDLKLAQRDYQKAAATRALREPFPKNAEPLEDVVVNGRRQLLPRSQVPADALPYDKPQRTSVSIFPTMGGFVRGERKMGGALEYLDEPGTTSGGGAPAGPSGTVTPGGTGQPTAGGERLRPRDPATIQSQRAGMARALPAFEKIVELSRGFNVGEGVTGKIGGLIGEAGSRMGANKPVNVYRTAVRGFMPLLARAIGHVGVLTEIDAQRTDELLGLPSDSDELREAKQQNFREVMARVANTDLGDPGVAYQALLGELETGLADKLGSENFQGQVSGGGTTTAPVEALNYDELP